MSEWYQQDNSQVLEQLQTSLEKGLTEQEVAERLNKNGANELIDKGGKNPWRIVWEQLTGIMTSTNVSSE